MNDDILIMNQKNYLDKIMNSFRSVKDSKETDIPIQPNHKLTNY